MQTFCDICNKSFCNSFSFKQHYKNVHEKTNSFRCDICEKVSNRKDNYDRHVRVCKAEFKCFTVTIRLSFHRIAHYMSTWSIRINYLSVITVALNSWTRERIKDTNRHARYSTTF